MRKRRFHTRDKGEVIFCFYNQSEEEQVADGVSRWLLVHGGKMMSVEVTFQTGAIRGQFGYRKLRLFFDLPERQPVTAGGNYRLGQGAFRR